VRGHAFVAAAIVSALSLAGAEARGEVRDSAERVADQWRKAGAAVALGTTRFLDDDETIAIALPSLPEGTCTTIVLIGARGISFHVKIAGAGEERDTDAGPRNIASVAGALSLERCGTSPVRRLLVTSDAGRGAIETVVAKSTAPLPTLRSILPERTGGTILPAPEPGFLPPLPPPDKRADTAERRAKRDGASAAARVTWHAGPDGAGAMQVELEAACHRFELFALDPRAGQPLRRGKLDLDAEMRDEDDHLVARDRTDAPDAHLDACVGQPMTATIVFAGSPASSPVLVTHVTWPLAEHLPTLWGSEAGAKMAAALLARHAGALREEAVFVAQGSNGMTPIPLPVEPGACYVAVASVVQGNVRGIGLRAIVGARDSRDDRGVADHSGAIAFCVGDQLRTRIEVEARGTIDMSWGLAVFRLKNGVWEVPR
jgi:hypothetical protein